MHQFDNPLVMTEEGHFVSDKWLRLNEILGDMDPFLELRWIPPKNRSNVDKSKPYAIVHNPPMKPAYTIMFAGDNDDPVDILARLWAGNTAKNDVQAVLDAKEAASKAFEMKKKMDEAEEAADQIHFLATNRSPWFAKHKLPNGQVVKLDTQTGRRV